MAKGKSKKGKSSPKVRHAQVAAVASINKATALIFLLLVMIGAGLFYFGTLQFQQDLEAERAELRRVEAELRTIEADITAIQEGSGSSLRALYDRVVFIDQQLPANTDLVNLAAWLSSVGEAGGAISPAGETSQGNLVGQRMSVAVNGSPGQVRSWYATVQGATDRFVTLDEVTVSFSDGEWTTNATVTAWSAPQDRLTGPGAAPPADVPSDTGDDAGTDEQAPQDEDTDEDTDPQDELLEDL